MVSINMNWNYLAECLRLLYWIYFKPFTLAEWLREIHPDLKSDTNPFSMRAEFSGNPKLPRYAGQVWLLMVVIPLIAVLLVGIIYSLVVEPFNWLRSSLILMGWLLANRIIRGTNSSLQIGLILMVMSMLFSFTLAIITEQLFMPEIQRLILQPSFFSVLLGLMYGMCFGMGPSVAFGTVFDVAFGVALGVASGVASGVAGVTSSGVAFGVAAIWGVTWGTTLGCGVACAIGCRVASARWGILCAIRRDVEFLEFGICYGYYDCRCSLRCNFDSRRFASLFLDSRITVDVFLVAFRARGRRGKMAAVSPTVLRPTHSLTDAFDRFVYRQSLSAKPSRSPTNHQLSH